ncbi:MAG: hypothetical protein ACLQLG_16815 [Thermoguttaceae bacterium]
MPPRSFATLAARISSWTIKGVLTALVLVAGLGFGRQVLRWWSADRRQSSAASATPWADDGLGDPAQPHVLRFGNQGQSLRRQTISGDQAAARAALLDGCRRLLQSEPAGGAAADRAAGKADRALLEALRRLRPTAEEPGKWRLYDLPGSLPLVVGIREGKAAGHSDAQAQLAEPTPGAVICGLAIPLATKVWTLYTFQPDSDAAGANSGGANIPIPPGSGRIGSMQVSQGGAITAFSGPDRADQWRQFYDDWFGQHGWKAAGAWQRTGSIWLLHYTASDPRQPAVADIRLSPDGRGQCTGLLMTSPGEF